MLPFAPQSSSLKKTLAHFHQDKNFSRVSLWGLAFSPKPWVFGSLWNRSKYVVWWPLQESQNSVVGMTALGWWNSIANGTGTSHLSAVEVGLKMRKKHTISTTQCCFLFCCSSLSAQQSVHWRPRMCQRCSCGKPGREQVLMRRIYGFLLWVS